MKKIVLALCFLISAMAASPSFAQEKDTPFVYPSIPDSKTTLSERCNYLVYHFWERCNLKEIFTRKNDVDKAMNDWLSFMPYATSDTVHMAIDTFIADVAKTGGDNILLIGKTAEKYLYTDSAEIYSEELYLPFCKAVADNKKIGKADRARFQAQTQVLENSALGAKAPAFEFVTVDGEKKSFGDVIASRIIVFFNDPDCIDCMMARTRLSADYNANELINRGLLKVVCIYPGKPTKEWKDAAASYPENWIIGASEDIDQYFDISEMPDFYYLDGKHIILGKHTHIDNLLAALMRININMN